MTVVFLATPFAFLILALGVFLALQNANDAGDGAAQWMPGAIDRVAIAGRPYRCLLDLGDRRREVEDFKKPRVIDVVEDAAQIIAARHR